MIIPQSTIDDVVLALIQNGGVATLTLPTKLSEVHREAFEVATLALDIASSSSSSSPSSPSSPSSSIPKIKENSNSAMVTGYHSAGSSNSLSRYNTYREGFIFSNGETFDINLPQHNNNNNNNNNVSFEQSMNKMFDSMQGEIAKSTLKGIARYLKIDDEDWFDNVYGPMDQSSQWHLKRYVEPVVLADEEEEDEAVVGGNDSKKGVEDEDEEEIEWLPVHTDPSLISVIIHDVPGYNQNAMGLQYQCPILYKQQKQQEKENKDNTNDTTNQQKKIHVWKEVEAHGHSVATIFCGSVMNYITGGLFASAKHRVVYKKRQIETRTDIMTDGGGSSATSVTNKYRQAATLFLRPRGNSVLTIPPCPILMERTVKIRKNLHFIDWLNRVSKNYQHKQKKK